MKPWRTTELRPGLTAQQLARHTGRSTDAARSAAKRHGVQLAPKHRGWPQHKRERALALRAEGRSYVAVQRVTSVPASTVRSWEKKDPLRAWMRKFRAYAAKRCRVTMKANV